MKKNWKNWIFAAIIAAAVITVGFIGCGNDETTKTFTVTFDSDGGTSVASQTVNEGSKANKPTDPVKENDVGGLYLGTPPDYTLIGWFNGSTQWDFNSPVTSNMTLKAQWTTPVPIDLAEIERDNILYQTVSYIKVNRFGDEFTLLLENDLECLAMVAASSINLTIIGIGSERTIRSDTIIFNMGSCSLTLGKNIILNSSNLQYGSIYNGNPGTNLTMLAGSKITGEVGLSSMAAYGNTIITVNGGIITGKAWIMNAQLILSGNAEIGNLALQSGYGVGKIIISSDWSGSIGKLDMEGVYSIDYLKDSSGVGFQDKELIHAANGYTLTQADIARFPLGNFQSLKSVVDFTVVETQPISDTHKLELDTVNNVIKLVAK
jgi:hypothetical protein